MKYLFPVLCGFLLFGLANETVAAQYRKLTVILLRHAEKDVSPTADKVNPDLSDAGRLRAQKLVKIINKYKPDAIFSSDFIRTKLTVAPLAEKRKITVQIYNHRNLKEMVDLIMSGKIKRLVIVGHNTTTPALVNMLLGQERYKALAETEYGKIWVVKIRKYKRKPMKVEERIIEY